MLCQEPQGRKEGHANRPDYWCCRGLGAEVARQLAAIGVEVVIGARDPQAAATAAGKLEGVRSYPAGLDIAS